MGVRPEMWEDAVNPHDLGVPHSSHIPKIEHGVGWMSDLWYRAMGGQEVILPKVLLGDVSLPAYDPHRTMWEQDYEWRVFLNYATKAFLDADWLSYAEIYTVHYRREVRFATYLYDPCVERYARMFDMTYMELRDMNHVYDKFNRQFRLSKQFMWRATCVNPE